MGFPCAPRHLGCVVRSGEEFTTRAAISKRHPNCKPDTRTACPHRRCRAAARQRPSKPEGRDRQALGVRFSRRSRPCSPGVGAIAPEVWGRYGLRLVAYASESEPPLPIVYDRCFRTAGLPADNIYICIFFYIVVK
jgi:hypothetical protein